jgi:serine/threonine protein kinase/Tol biopolymer transport system component
MSDLQTRLFAALEGRYRIERELGAGGMATVFLAHDERHERRVAVKVLKPELAAVMGADRFLSEIRTTANLQHPHILPLFDSGEADGFVYYVMPYVEGETLRERMDREKQLPVDDAVRLCAAVAGALDYAHRQGIVHRDIKPANILLHDGQPQVADFGIALAVQQAGGGRLTETGLSLGTPHYMSPEQATADRDPDARSDVYSLACVLYEMLTGEPPFPGSTAQAVLGKIITAQPAPPTEHRRSIPKHLEAVILKALEKLPADRFASAADFADALTDPTVGATLVTRRVARGRAAAPSRATPVLAAAVVALAIAAAWGWLRPDPLERVSRYAFQLPEEQAFRFSDNSLTLTPDGSAVVYAGTDVDGPALFLRPLNALEPTRILGTDRGFAPSVSPDGSRVAFTADNEGGTRTLRVASLAGGGVVTLTDSLVDQGGVSWGDDGYIYYDAHFEGDGIARIPEEGGEPERVTNTDFDGGEIWHFQPHTLPGGKGVLFTIARGEIIGAGDFQVAVHVGSGEPHKVLVDGATSPRYARSGHLIFVRDRQILAVPFDADRMEVTGAAVPVVEGVAVQSLGRAHLAVSDDGTLAYSSGTSTRVLAELTWLDREGNLQSIDSDFTGIFSSIELSPDGRAAAIEVLDPVEETTSIWTMDLETGATRKLTFEGMSGDPSWSPDGQEIIFVHFDLTTREGGVNVVPSDGRALPQRLFEYQGRSGGDWNDPRFAPDGSSVLLAVGGSTSDIQLWREGQDPPLQSLELGPANSFQAAISPDGRWIAYASNETGQPQVYVRPYPGTQTSKALVSRNGGGFPKWSRDGSELYFVSFDNEIMVVDVATAPTFTASTPRVLFARDVLAGRPDDEYDPHPDGRRFLNIAWAGDVTRDNDLVVVEGFSTELRNKVGR